MVRIDNILRDHIDAPKPIWSVYTPNSGRGRDFDGPLSLTQHFEPALLDTPSKGGDLPQTTYDVLMGSARVADEKRAVLVNAERSPHFNTMLREYTDAISICQLIAYQHNVLTDGDRVTHWDRDAQVAMPGATSLRMECVLAFVARMLSSARNHNYVDARSCIDSIADALAQRADSIHIATPASTGLYEQPAVPGTYCRALFMMEPWSVDTFYTAANGMSYTLALLRAAQCAMQFGNALVETIASNIIPTVFYPDTTLRSPTPAQNIDRLRRLSNETRGRLVHFCELLEPVRVGFVRILITCIVRNGGIFCQLVDDTTSAASPPPAAAAAAAAAATTGLDCAPAILNLFTPYTSGGGGGGGDDGDIEVRETADYVRYAIVRAWLWIDMLCALSKLAEILDMDQRYKSRRAGQLERANNDMCDAWLYMQRTVLDMSPRLRTTAFGASIDVCRSLAIRIHECLQHIAKETGVTLCGLPEPQPPPPPPSPSPQQQQRSGRGRNQDLGMARDICDARSTRLNFNVIDAKSIFEFANTVPVTNNALADLWGR